MRNRRNVLLKLKEIICKAESDFGFGGSEPYLWTVFFKIDGDSVSCSTEKLTLSGNATVHTTSGSHGNLNVNSVKSGDTISIPDKIGEWETILSPISFSSSMDLNSYVGVVCVLMEEDNVSDEGAQAGHSALNTCVKDALNKIISTRSFENKNVSEDEMKEFQDKIESAITEAIKSQQNIFENLWSWLNPDDSLGSKVFLFSLDDLKTDNNKSFSEKWKSNKGKDVWEINGKIESTKIPIAVY